MSEKIKLTREELNDMFDITDEPTETPKENETPISQDDEYEISILDAETKLEESFDNGN